MLLARLLLLLVAAAAGEPAPAARSAYDSALARRLLLLSDAAYCGDDQHGGTSSIVAFTCPACVAAVAAGGQVRSIATIQNATRQTMSFVGLAAEGWGAAAGPPKVVVVFRGSVLKVNFADDADQALHLLPQGGRVHRGMYTSYSSIAAGTNAAVRTILAANPSVREIIATGHSHNLGAGQAVFSADELAAVHPSLSVVMYSFGTPRPGDLAFAQRLNKTANLQAWAVAHRADTVPQCGIHKTPCDERKLGLHQIATNIWYPAGLAGRSPGVPEYVQCDGSGQDPTCQDRVPQKLLNWNDHNRYLNHSMYCCSNNSIYTAGKPGCSFPFPGLKTEDARAIDARVTPFVVLDPHSDWEIFQDLSHGPDSANCDKRDGQDSMLTVTTSARGETVAWTAVSGGTRRAVGSSLDSGLKRQCHGAPLWNSTTANGDDEFAEPMDPSRYANAQWVQLAHKLPDGRTMALLHNEFDQHNHSAMWSTGIGISGDVATEPFRLIAKPPEHRVFSTPYKYNATKLHTVGMGAIATALLAGKDGALYGMVNVRGPEAEQAAGNCAFRVVEEDLLTPSAYRGWRSNAGFNVSFIDPYVDDCGDNCWPFVCEPVVGAGVEHLSPRRISLASAAWEAAPPLGFPNFLLFSDHGVETGDVSCQWSFEDDYAKAVTSWSPGVKPQVLDLELSRWFAGGGGGGGAGSELSRANVIYPSIIDSSSPIYGDENYGIVGNKSLYIYAEVQAHTMRRRVFLSATQPSKPEPAPKPKLGASCFKVAGAGLSSANGEYKKTAITSNGSAVFAQSGAGGLSLLRTEGQWTIGGGGAEHYVLFESTAERRRLLPLPLSTGWRAVDVPRVSCVANATCKCAAVSVSGAGLAGVAGRYADAGRRSNGSQVFELDADHQLYRYTGLFKLGKVGDYSKQYYVATASSGDAAAALPSIGWRCASCSGAMKKAPAPLSVLAGCAFYPLKTDDDAAVPVVDGLATLSKQAGLPPSSATALAADGWDASSLHLATIDDLRRLGFNTASSRKLMAAVTTANAQYSFTPSSGASDFKASTPYQGSSGLGANGLVPPTARSLEARAADRFNVKDFGALGDGSGLTPADTHADVSTEKWNNWTLYPFYTNHGWSAYWQNSAGKFIPPRPQPFLNIDTWDSIGINLAIWTAANKGEDFCGGLGSPQYNRPPHRWQLQHGRGIHPPRQLPYQRLWWPDQNYEGHGGVDPRSRHVPSQGEHVIL